MSELDQTASVGRLPSADRVDRVEWLRQRASGQRVIHVGFADAGFRENQQSHDTWLHSHLSEVAESLVGIDLDPEAVDRATAEGLDAHVVDCTDATAVAALDLEPADLVIAGEIIEHLGAPGPFLDGLHPLCRDSGTLVVTTPNAYGLLNVGASLVGYELNHPDHVVMFTWRTLAQLLERTGWAPTATHTYVPSVRSLDGASARARVLAMGARTVLAIERGLARVGAPFACDGLIVEARPAD